GKRRTRRGAAGNLSQAKNEATRGRQLCTLKNQATSGREFGHTGERDDGLGEGTLEGSAGGQSQGTPRARGRRAPARGPAINRSGQDLVGGVTPGLSLKNCLFMSVKFFHWSGTSSSAKIAFTGHTGSQAPQSMHSSGWMYSMSFPS